MPLLATTAEKVKTGSRAARALRDRPRCRQEIRVTPHTFTIKESGWFLVRATADVLRRRVSSSGVWLVVAVAALGGRLFAVEKALHLAAPAFFFLLPAKRPKIVQCAEDFGEARQIPFIGRRRRFDGFRRLIAALGVVAAIGHRHARG